MTQKFLSLQLPGAYNLLSVIQDLSFTNFWFLHFPRKTAHLDLIAKKKVIKSNTSSMSNKQYWLLGQPTPPAHIISNVMLTCVYSQNFSIQEDH